MSQKAKGKRKWGVAVIVVAGILVVVLGGGYFAVNTMFSIFTRSFYQSSITQEEQNAPPDALSSAQPDEPSREEEENQQEPLQEENVEQAPDVGSSKGTALLTSEQLKKLEGKVSFSDKLAVMSLLSKGLPSAEYAELAGMVSGGISNAEAQRALNILKTSLDQEIKNKIKEYYAKYAHLIQ